MTQMQDHSRKLLNMLAKLAPGGAEEALHGLGLERRGGVMEESMAPIRSALENAERQVELSPEDQFSLEAIVLPDLRPVLFINNNVFDVVQMSIWQHLNDAAVRNRLQPLFRSVGRVEVPLQPSVPYGGTAFVVGPNLLMTNRHVARIFSEGRGRHIFYQDGSAAVDLLREQKTPPTTRQMLQVTRVEMVHPFWDMALLRVAELPVGVRPLPLSVMSPEELLDRDIVVVGFPARDFRNDLEIQDRVFSSTYGVKRMQPGKIRPRVEVVSFENRVHAMVHDSSTLGGNSGSVLIDVSSGEAVGLHFAGEYLKANYAVPTFELARDSRVLAQGLNFTGRVATTDEFDRAWRLAGEEKPESHRSRNSDLLTIQSGATGHSIQATVPQQGGPMSFVVPLNVTITLGEPGSIPGNSQSMLLADGGSDLVEKVPVIYPGLPKRDGYQEDFLKIKVPMPKLTEAGREATLRLSTGSRILSYHHFSIVMHKVRRMALFTAANVDWRDLSRNVNGAKPSRKVLNGFSGNEKEDWVNDPRVPEDHQIPDYFYTKDRGSFDRGHLVRRDDVAWGKSFKDMQKGNGDTFHMTNCSPQVAKFNQSKFGKFNWGGLENMIQKQTQAEQVCVFSGPVLDPDDPTFEGFSKSGTRIEIQVPLRYWKMVVAINNDKPAVFGFILDQDLADVDLTIELAIPEQWKSYLKPIAEIEQCLQGLVSLTWFKKWDQHSH